MIHTDILIQFAFILMVAWGTARLLGRSMISLLAASGLVRDNFRGDPTPVGSGLAVVGAAFITGAAAMVSNITTMRLGSAMIVAALGFGFTGFLDDSLGDRSTTGLRGHLVAMMHGRLTTGAVKAVFGVILGMVLAYLVRGLHYEIVVDGLIIALSANAVNLFDVRPGRALKAAFLSGIALAGLGGFAVGTLPMVALVLGAGSALIGWDLRGEAMMGDVGANTLGAVLGLAIAAGSGVLGRTLFLIVLVYFHLWAEQNSLTRRIETSAFLTWLDGLGRGD